MAVVPFLVAMLAGGFMPTFSLKVLAWVIGAAVAVVVQLRFVPLVKP
jgi:hypothetical protein